MRLNRNGIPILDPPREANKMRQRCHPSQHRWRKTGERFVERDWYFDYEIYEIESRCTVCGARDTEKITR